MAGVSPTLLAQPRLGVAAASASASSAAPAPAAGGRTGEPGSREATYESGSMPAAAPSSARAALPSPLKPRLWAGHAPGTGGMRSSRGSSTSSDSGLPLVQDDELRCTAEHPASKTREVTPATLAAAVDVLAASVGRLEGLGERFARDCRHPPAAATAAAIVSELGPWLRGEIERAAERAAERTAIRTAEWVMALMGAPRRGKDLVREDVHDGFQMQGSPKGGHVLLGALSAGMHGSSSALDLRNAAKVEEYFRRLDADSDGQISKEEAVRYFRGHFAKVSARAMFCEVDVNTNQLITMSEFRDFWDGVRRAGYSNQEISDELDQLLAGDTWVDWHDGRQVTPGVEGQRVADKGVADEATSPAKRSEPGREQAVDSALALAALDNFEPSRSSHQRRLNGGIPSIPGGSLAALQTWSNRKSAIAALSCMTVRNQTEEERTSKAIIVNFRRMIDMRELFGIMHEIMKSTTIAFLTLMSARSPSSLVSDLLFIIAGVSLYALHANKYDTFDISDFNNLVELLGDDGTHHLMASKLPMDNPNRWLQAVAHSTTRFQVCLPYLFLLLFVFLDFWAWVIVVGLWVENDFCTSKFGVWTYDDLEHPGTLLLVGTLMLMCHLAFELMYWRETQYCMPLKGGRPWRIKEDGLPRDMHMNWLFGPPCMWFSTPQAYDDLRIWVTLATGAHAHDGPARSQNLIHKVFFEELALYALQDETSATRLRRSLLEAKLFDKRTDSFLRRVKAEPATTHKSHVIMRGVTKMYSERSHDGKVHFVRVDPKAGEHPEELSLDLLFYDNRSGVYWAPDSMDAEVFRDKVASYRLRSSGTLTPRSMAAERTEKTATSSAF